MRVGVSLKSAYVVDDVRTGADWMVERARAAWRAGLDSLFVGDHHAVPVPYYQNTAILGRLLAEWGDRPAGALYLLPLWNPVLVAEQVGTLAAIAKGRFILQCAIGGGGDQFQAMGASLRTRPSAFEASLDVIRRLLAGEPVSTEEPYELREVRVNPVTPEPLEVWIGGHAPAAIDRAARLGDVWLAGPEATPQQAADLVAVYRQSCDRHGRQPSTVAIRRDVFVGEDEAHADRLARPVVEGGYRGFDPAACVFGGPERVAEQLAELGAMGFTDVIVRHLVDDQGEVLDSFARLGHVRRLVADR